MSNDTGKTVVGRVSTPPAPVDPSADTVVPGREQKPQPPQTSQRRTEARTTAPRPASTAPVYGFRIGALKEPIGLDRPARVGRRPTGPRIVVGAPPRLVRVVSPQREVSATHIELRQTGVSVVVTDLRSTNGTTVLLPGLAPRKLLQGESVVVSPGTLVDIGDDTILQILSLDRRPQ